MLSPVPAVNWTGFYVGGHLGGAWGYFRNNGTNIGPSDVGGGFAGGGQGGFNYQMGRVVLGVEGDISAIDIHADTATIGDFKEKWTSSIRGRLGYTVEDYLAYLTAGAAFTHVTTSVTGGGSGSATVAGFTGGFGVEKMFTPNWSARVEALYANVPLHTFNITGGPVIGGSHNYIVRVGVNYLFH